MRVRTGGRVRTYTPWGASARGTHVRPRPRPWHANDARTVVVQWYARVGGRRRCCGPAQVGLAVCEHAVHHTGRGTRTHGTAEALIRARRTHSSGPPGQAALRLRHVRHAGGRCAYPVCAVEEAPGRTQSRHGQRAWSKGPPGSAPARPLHLSGARPAALAGLALLQGQSAARWAPSCCLGSPSQPAVHVSMVSHRHCRGRG